MDEKRYVRVRVKTGTRKERIQQVGEGVYTIEVREKAEQGKANARIRILLAETLGIRPEDIRMVKGATSPSKTYLLA